MIKEKVFCEECRKDVAFTVTLQRMDGHIKGEKYSYQGKSAHCAECNSEIYVAEINDYNLKALYDEYREKKDIVSVEMILEISKKYAIGKRPISLLLGWGEQTFSRYCDGDIPTKQYSDMLKKIYDDPNYYNELLEKNKANLPSDKAYKKSKRAVNELITKCANTKIDLAIEYLLNQCEDITPLSLQKALYYIQGFYYAFYREFLFTEECQAWAHGPVYRDIYFRYRDYRFEPIEGKTDFDDSVFSTAEKAVLDSVVKNICCYSGKVLEKFTHSEAPWLAVRGELPDNAPSDRIIPKEQIGRYFYVVKEKYNMLNPNDIQIYAQNMFQQL